MNRFDFTPYRRSTVGFDRIFDLLESNTRAQQSENYPPFNIERSGEDHYRITLAVAGFKDDEVEITAQQNLLLVAGNKNTDDSEGKQYLHMGIANRNFERRFELADFVRVDNAALSDGLLVIDLVREIPDAMKPQKIAINKSDNVTKIVDERQKAEDKAAWKYNRQPARSGCLFMPIKDAKANIRIIHWVIRTHGWQVFLLPIWIQFRSTWTYRKW